MTQPIEPIFVQFNYAPGKRKPLPFRYLAASEFLVRLYRDNVPVKTLRNGFDYRITPDADTAKNEGEIEVFNMPDAAGAYIDVRRNTDPTQDWVAPDGARGAEIALDRLAMVAQEVKAELADLQAPMDVAGYAVRAEMAAAAAQINSELAEVNRRRKDRELGRQSIAGMIELWELSKLKWAQEDKARAPLVDPSLPLIERNKRIWLRRIHQMAKFVWTSAPGTNGVPKPAVYAGQYFTPGTPVQGPPYSSVRDMGHVIGLEPERGRGDVSIRTFRSMTKNPNSIIYSRILWDQNNPYYLPFGGSFAACVCSSVLQCTYDYYINALTPMISKDWQRWGFRKEIPNCTAQEIELGDAVVTNGGGHIEACTSKDDGIITLFDLGFDGVAFTGWSHDGFEAYCVEENYKILKFDWEAVDFTYKPNPYSLLDDEDLAEGAFNDIIMLNHGDASNYHPDDPVEFNITSADVQRIVVQRDGQVVDEILTPGIGVTARNYPQTGYYTAHCVMQDGSQTKAEEFCVARVDGTLAQSTIAEGDTFTINATKDNAELLSVEVYTRDSLRNGVTHEITDAERASGTITLTHDQPGNHRVRLRAVTRYGTVFNLPRTAMILTIT